MTRKDYVLIAETLNRTYANFRPERFLAYVEKTAERMAR